MTLTYVSAAYILLVLVLVHNLSVVVMVMRDDESHSDEVCSSLLGQNK